MTHVTKAHVLVGTELPPVKQWLRGMEQRSTEPLGLGSKKPDYAIRADRRSKPQPTFYVARPWHAKPGLRVSTPILAYVTVA